MASVLILGSAGILGYLIVKYRDRALFSRHREGNTRSIPGIPLFGSLFGQIANKHRILDYTMEYFNKYDTMTIHSTALGLPSFVLTIDPKNIEHVLKDIVRVTYLDVESLLQMANIGKSASLIFNVVNFRDHFTEIFIKELNILSEFVLDKKAVTGEVIELQDMAYKFTLDSFVLLGFGKNLDILTSKEKIPFAVSFDICQKNCHRRLVDPLTNMRQSLKTIFRPNQPTIKDHSNLKQGNEYKDLLSRFMTTRNENGQPLNDKELRDMVLNFVIAGRDITAQSISWTFYLLLKHPRVEAKLLAEVNQYITDETMKNAPLLYETIKKMPYAHAVLFEVLRLEPIVPSNGMTALEDDVLPDGTVVHRGDKVVWVPYAMGRSTKIWGDDATDFKPERWITPDGELRRETAFKWPAFHAGPRVCLGQNLAILEALVAISILLKRYKFSLSPGQKIQYDMSLTHPMKNGMKVFVEKRNN